MENTTEMEYKIMCLKNVFTNGCKKVDCLRGYIS